MEPRAPLHLTPVARRRFLELLDGLQCLLRPRPGVAGERLDLAARATLRFLLRQADRPLMVLLQDLEKRDVEGRALEQAKAVEMLLHLCHRVRLALLATPVHA